MTAAALLVVFALVKPAGGKIPAPDQLLEPPPAEGGVAAPKVTLISDQRADEAPVWAEGGRSIAFRSTRKSWLGKKYKNPAADQQIWLVRLDTGEQVNLADGIAGPKSLPSWNASLNRVIVYADLKKGGPGIYALDPASPSGVTRVADPPFPAGKKGAVPALSSSKDGKVIVAVASYEGQASELWVRRLGEPSWRKLPIGEIKNVQRAVFAPDDQTLYTWSLDDMLGMRGPIYRVTLDGKVERTKQVGCCVNVHPTGEELLYVQNRAVQSAALPSVGWKATLLRPRQGSIVEPRWSPDGTAIAFSWFEGELGGIYVARFDRKTLEVARKVDKPRGPKVPIPAASRQLVVVVSPAWGDDLARLARYERASETAPWKPVGQPGVAVIGDEGLGWGIGLHGAGAPAADTGPPGPLKAEGDRRSPAGVFALGEVIGYDVKAPEGARTLYRQATPELRCVDDPASTRYNRIVPENDTRDWSSAEKMKRDDDLYKLVVTIAHNAQEPPRKGGGSCIFLHVWGGVKAKTVGCTALPYERLAEIVKWLDPQAEPVVVQLPESAYRAVMADWALPPPPM